MSRFAAISIPFWILSVKYDDYALAYSCVNIDKNYRQGKFTKNFAGNPPLRVQMLTLRNTLFVLVHSWKLSRSRELSNTGNAAINDAITNIDVIDNRYFDNTDQSDEACFHLPDLAPGEDVVLPGRCDTTIKGIDDFNITAVSFFTTKCNFTRNCRNKTTEFLFILVIYFMITVIAVRWPVASH